MTRIRDIRSRRRRDSADCDSDAPTPDQVITVPTRRSARRRDPFPQLLLAQTRCRRLTCVDAKCVRVDAVAV